MKAFYDNKPSKFEKVGNGSFLYRYGINEVEVAQQVSSEDGEATDTQATKTQYECNEVVVWSPYSSNTILEAVIRDRWDNNYEQKLINEYNGAQLGIYGAKTTDEYKAVVQAYTDFLTERNTLKETVDADCKELGIE